MTWILYKLHRHWKNRRKYQQNHYSSYDKEQLSKLTSLSDIIKSKFLNPWLQRINECFQDISHHRYDENMFEH